MSTVPRSIKGTFDILPNDAFGQGAVPPTPVWVAIENTLREVFSSFGMGEIRTPILEPTNLVARGVGEETDIVSKEMFSFEKSGTAYVLRPEITAPVMRAYIQNNLDQGGAMQRLFYIGPCFRAERPQKGRYRQFHQFGCELIGSDSTLADAEVILCMIQVYEKLGIEDIRLRINSLGDSYTRPRYIEALREYLTPYESELSETSKTRLRENPLRLLDTKNQKEKSILRDGPSILEHLDQDSREKFDQLQDRLTNAGVAYTVDPMLVRGLDYYSHTAFELECDSLGAQNALAGGGRYDLLAKEIGYKQPIPAVGFAAGMERLFLALDNQVVSDAGPDVYFAGVTARAREWSFFQAQILRRKNVAAVFDLNERSLKAQLRAADRLGARRVVIVGDDELKSGTVLLKNMLDGTQRPVPIEQIISQLATTFGDVS